MKAKTKTKSKAKKPTRKYTRKAITDHFTIETGVQRTTGRHKEVVIKVLNSMMKVKKAGQSFLVPTEDKGEARSIQGAVNYLKKQYQKDLADGVWTTMIVYNKGKQIGIRIFFD